MKTRKQEYNRQYREKHRDKLNAYSKAYYQDNIIKAREVANIYYINNKEHVLKIVAEYRKKEPDKIRNLAKHYNKRRKSIDLLFKLKILLRDRFIKAVKKNAKKGSAVRDLGCSIEFFKEYLEQQFQPGMSWDNWTRNGWHIDHIKPLTAFDLTLREEVVKACHYTNLQPLWALDNIRKGNKLV